MWENIKYNPKYNSVPYRNTYVYTYKHIPVYKHMKPIYKLENSHVVNIFKNVAYEYSNY